ncbi:hypothetical protein ABT127_05395 [Streptomyces sp. NPDC001904]|uniref:hypothetical protein n=1 Tax=Streptomyces sp. NPDC001904 TaxID=3154531 RepID=UPI0033278808
MGHEPGAAVTPVEGPASGGAPAPAAAKPPLPIRYPDASRPNPGRRRPASAARAKSGGGAAPASVPPPAPAPESDDAPAGPLDAAPEPDPVSPFDARPEPTTTDAASAPVRPAPAQPDTATITFSTQALAPPVDAEPTPVPSPDPSAAPPTPPGQPPAPVPHSAVPAVRPRTAAPAVPFPAPESVPTVDPRLTQAVGRPVHGDSVARRTGQSIRRLAAPKAQAGGAEARLARELQVPLTSGRVVAVTSIRGGVGKTTTAALVARTLQRERQDPVLALEADAALGTLAVRLGAPTVRWSITELAQILTPEMHLLDITGYLVPLPDGGWLLPASQGRVGPPLDIPTYRTVTLALRRHFAVTVADCETLPGEVARTAMDTAHARVVVAPMTVEGVGGTRVVLDWLSGLPHSALSSTVVALTSGTPDQNLDLGTAMGHLRETGVGVVHLPYDRHLAAGGPIREELLSTATRRATAQLAAEALHRAARAR